jgi:hypothetical protein
VSLGEFAQVLLDALTRTARAVRATGDRPVLHGGIAVNVRGRERTTKDVDVAIDGRTEHWAALLAALRSEGARLPERALERVERDGMLPVFFGAVRVDLLFPMDPLTRHVIEGATDEEVLGVRLGVARAEDLIVMKLLARRVQDVEDVKGLLVANRDRLDLERIRRWLPDLDAWKPGASELFERLKREFHDPLPG